jgi:hypothetical protein
MIESEGVARCAVGVRLGAEARHRLLPIVFNARLLLVAACAALWVDTTDIVVV